MEDSPIIEHLGDGIYRATHYELPLHEMDKFYNVPESDVPVDRPYTWYMAVMSKDGVIALKDRRNKPQDIALSGRNVWSASDWRALEFLWHRGKGKAVFAGSGILRAEPNVTWEPQIPEIRNYRTENDLPLKVLLTTKAEDFDLTHKAFNANSDVIVFTSKIGEMAIMRQLDQLTSEGRLPSHVPVVYALGENKVEDYKEMMRILRQDHKIKYMDLQGGGKVAGQLLYAKVIDELRLTTSPTTFGRLNSKGEPRTSLFEDVSFEYNNSPQYHRIKLLHAGNHQLERSRIEYHH